MFACSSYREIAQRHPGNKKTVYYRTPCNKRLVSFTKRQIPANRAVFSVDSNPELLWFCFTTLWNWLKKKCKTNRNLVTRFAVLFRFVVIRHCNCFGFGFTKLN